MAERKVVPFDEFYYQLKLMYLFQKHPVCMSTKKSKFGKIRKKKEQQENICIIFFNFLSVYFIRLQIVGAVVLIHPVCIYLRSTFCFVTFPTHTL
jgi:hypothetical protein